MKQSIFCQNHSFKTVQLQNEHKKEQLFKTQVRTKNSSQIITPAGIEPQASEWDNILLATVNEDTKKQRKNQHCRKRI